jgi:ADP-ribose pyrophosphatase YjhB (NUDIX family)
MQLPVLFVQDSGAGKTDFTHLPADLYSVIRGCMPIYCVDIVAIDKNRKLFYLAVRRRAPRMGWWWFGGRVGQDELPQTAAQRIMLRETKLDIKPERLTVVGVVFHYINEPSNGIKSTFPAIQLAFEPTREELSSIRLDTNEYDTQTGVQGFVLGELAQFGANSTVIAMYNSIFSESRIV